MKKFFEEHGGVAIILIVIAILLLIVGSVKGLDEGTGKVNGSGVASIVGNAYSSAIDKFDESFDNTLNGADPSKEIAKKLGLDRFGITSIKQICSDEYSYDRGKIMGLEYKMQTRGFGSQSRPGLYIRQSKYMVDYLEFTERDFTVGAPQSISENYSGNFFIKESGSSSFLNGYDTIKFMENIKYTSSCLEIESATNSPIYFANSDTGFLCYVLNGEWNILREGK